MALSTRLQFKQSQSLVMTPQLMQSIKLLQMSNVELTAFVEAELERNPLLERDQRLEGEAAGESSRESSGEAENPNVEASDEARQEDWMQQDLETSPEAISAKIDARSDDLFPDDVGESTSRTVSDRKIDQKNTDQWTHSGGQIVGETSDLEAFIPSEITLREHLTNQLSLSGEEPAIRLIAAEMIDEIEDSGYMRADLDAMADRLNASPEKVLEALRLVQTFEPTGVGSRDLKECLSIQLREKDHFDPAMQAMIDNLELLAKRDFDALRKLCGVGDEDLLDMMEEIRHLDPKPGTAFNFTPLSPAIPDVIVQPANDGSWNIELNNENLPRVLVNRDYIAKVSKAVTDETGKEFITDCLQTANWLTKSLDQRAQTILKVAAEIVAHQDAFLLHGVQHLRPLTLKTVADAIDMHESTISRVTSNKYMLTHRGIFELKYFFTTAIASAEVDGDALSSEAVRDQIRQLIANEAENGVLSDDGIVDALKYQGVDIARRTVAKYREAMNIPSSVQRRREIKAKTRALST